MISGLSTMKVLIIKLSAIGDVLHTLPALDLLRQGVPGNSLNWVVEEKAAGILIGHPHLDKVMVSGRKRWIHDLARPSRWPSVLREAASFIRELRSDRYDLVIDFQGLFKSAILVLLSRGACKIGYAKTRELSYLALTHRIDPPPAELHAVDKNIGLVRAILELPELSANRSAAYCQEATQHSGKASDGIAVPGEKEIRSVDELLRSSGFDPSQPLILVNAPAGWESKRWDGDTMAALADRLMDVYKAHLIYTGAAGDAAYIDGIIGRMHWPALNAAGRTTLKELACLIKRARLIVTTDSGPMHLAAAVGTPVVAIFGPTAPWRTGPYTDRARIVRAQAACSPCYKRTCDSMICMKGIGVDEVMEAAAVVMGTEGTPGT
jgi:3-deoxy-D-manno-octulosonic-acid transferase/heptosyltransferase-1